MTARLKPREMGCVLECDGCGTCIHTGQILIGSIRAYARSIGWGRGLIPAGRKRFGTLRNDYCATCMVPQREQAAEIKRAKAERRAKRDAKRKALDAKLREGYERADAEAAAQAGV